MMTLAHRELCQCAIPTISGKQSLPIERRGAATSEGRRKEDWLAIGRVGIPFLNIAAGVGDGSNVPVGILEGVEALFQAGAGNAEVAG